MVERKLCDFCGSPLYRNVGPCPCVEARKDPWTRSWLNLQPYAMGVRINEIQDKYKCSVEALAKMVNRIPSWVSARSALARLDPQIGRALDEQPYKQDDIDRAEKIANLPNNRQKGLWDARNELSDTAFRREVRRLKQEVKRV